MATAATRDGHILRPLTNSSQRAAVIDAVGGYDISSDPAWSELDVLSTHTQFDSIEVVPEGIFDAGNDRFEAVATVYVVLNYGSGDDALQTTETFPAHISGHFEGSSASVDSADVDTSSFTN